MLKVPAVVVRVLNLNKKCNRCETDKPLKDFYNNPCGKYGKTSICKTCEEHSRNCRKNNIVTEIVIMPKEGHKRCTQCKLEWSIDYFSNKTSGVLGKASACKICMRRYKAHLNYGVDLYWLPLKAKEQNNSCAICEEEFFDTRDAHIDHDHDTGKVRELLCRACNHAIGNVKESVDVLNKIINYLNKHKEY